jgi:hypothetical protein
MTYTVVVKGGLPLDLARKISEAHAAALNSARRRKEKYIAHADQHFAGTHQGPGSPARKEVKGNKKAVQ